MVNRLLTQPPKKKTGKAQVPAKKAETSPSKNK